MEEMHNLTYSIQVDYINAKGLNVSICKKVNDKGLETNLIKIGDVCITEETIKGRILSGRIDVNNTYCGYRYNYDKGADEYLVNLNDNVLLDTAVSMINKTKMQSDFLTARMVLVSVLRGDYRVLSLDKGNLSIIKTVTAENEQTEKCYVQENIVLTKNEGEKVFTETKKEMICAINGNKNVENVKIKLKELIEVVNKNPYCYNELIVLKQSLKMAKSLTI